MLRTALRTGFVAGLLATIALVALLYLASALVQLSFIPFDLADLIIRITPGRIATEGIEALGAVAKLSIKAGAIMALVLFGGGLGALVAKRLVQRGEAARLGATNLASLVMVGTLLAIALLNYRPSQPSPLQPAPILVLLALVWLWSIALSSLLRGVMRPSSAEPATDQQRRTFLIKSGAAVVTVAVGSTALAELLKTPANAAGAAATLPEPSLRATEQAVDTGGFIAPNGVRAQITPQSELYYVSSRVRDPRVDTASYHLTIDGSVDQPLTFTLDQLQQLPRVDQTGTLECISNEVGGDLIGNCRWNGTRLADLLRQAGIHSSAQRLVLQGADGYVDSIAVEDALKATTLVVYGIDDQPLTTPHGYPARLIVPNIYGMKNVKWLQRIEVVDNDFQGFWQERGWSQPAVVKTTSVTDTAGTLQLENGVVPLGGIAFAGSRRIERVEVHIDNGAWNAATLEPVSSSLQWRRWRYDWPATPGKHVVAVRAVEGTGDVQTAAVAAPHPDGASGYHRITVNVRG
jgi:DMSO/TMAO reductase YedYZ molybdopterin-dependent catalytic subunit